MPNKGWTSSSLGELVEIKHGFAFKGEFFSDRPPGNVLLTPGNFSIGGGFKDDKFKYYNGPVPDEFVLKESDLIVTMTDLSKQGDTLGYPAIVPRSDSHQYLHNQRLGKVEILKDSLILKKYLYYLMRTDEYRNEILASATGTTVKHTSPNRIKLFEFLLPPLPEQRAIAHILGTLDDKIELNRRMNETLEAMARTIFKSWFVDFDPVRTKADGREPASMDAETAALFPDSFEETELGMVPKGWKIFTLSHFVELNPESWSKITAPIQIEYVDLANTKRGRIESTAKHFWKDAPSRAQRVLRPGDTIVGTVRPANGSYALITEEGLTGSTGFAVLRPSKPEFREFIYLAATAAENIERLAYLADGAAYPAVRPEVVADTAFHYAGNHIVSLFSKVVGPMLRSIAANDHESRTLIALGDMLRPKLLSGELKVDGS